MKHKNQSLTKTQRKEKITSTIINSFFILISMLMVIPMLLVISISFTDEQALKEFGYRFIPVEFSTQAYQVLFQAPETILRAYGVTLFVTVVGTLLTVFVVAMLAYVISRSDFRYRKITTFFVFFTMLFSGGLVPYFILITQYLNLSNSIWALIIPLLTPPFMVMIMKGFLGSTIPFEIIESAKIDGSGEWRIFLQIVLPISIPALATLSLLISFNFWNEWMHGLLFIEDRNLYPLQLMLYHVLENIDFLENYGAIAGITDLENVSYPSLSARMATALLVTGPIMFIFPFFQRYFVKGLTIGSLK